MSEETTVEDVDPDAACYYDRLGLDPRVEDPATAAESAYHDANALKKRDELSAKEFTKIRDARDFLQDDERREQYDTFLERFGREAGTEAYHTWEDQGRPAPPERWMPSSQSADAGPRSGPTPDADSDTDSGDADARRTPDHDRDRGEDDRSPDRQRRRRRQQARRQERQSRSSETTGRDRQRTTRDSGARTGERQRDEQSGGPQQRRQSEGQQQSREEQRGDTGATTAAEAATATWYRVGYLVCALGAVATGGLFAAFALDVLSVQNEVGQGLVLGLLTAVGIGYVTRKWTDDVEATPDPDTVYDNVLLRPGLVKRAAIAGVGLAVLQTLVQEVLPELVLSLIGFLSAAGFVLLPLAYAVTQFYDVTLEHVADAGDQ